MAVRDKIRFLLGDEALELKGIDPNRTLLDYLRAIGRVGTKEGCAEGDCGACTVVVGELHGGEIRYRAVNACIQILGVLDGKQVLTIEDLSARNAPLHPVQTALVEANATQCGFCTPGFAMSLFALYRKGEHVSQQELKDALAGNLCRCTGYGPIIEAGQKALSGDVADGFEKRAAAAHDQLTAWEAEDESLHYEAGGRKFFAPRSLGELQKLLKSHPSAVLVAGLTDVGLWITKQNKRLDAIISLNSVAELLELSEGDGCLQIGAAVTYSDALTHLADYWPGLGELLRRLGSLQIRNAGTIGGNIANGSPIGDTPPALIALGARIVLTGPEGARTLPVEEFFLAYGRQDLKEGEVLTRIDVPLPHSGELFRCYKLSKRFDQDISALCGAYRLILDETGSVSDARIAYGGMAGIPKRADAAEKALLGSSWDEGALEKAVSALDSDFEPLSDWRASAGYRKLAAGNLLRRFHVETSGGGEKTHVLQLGEAING